MTPGAFRFKVKREAPRLPNSSFFVCIFPSLINDSKLRRRNMCCEKNRKSIVSAVILGAVVCMVFALSLTSVPQARAALPGVNGKIAFASERDGNSEIYVMDGDGISQTRLTNS